MNYVERTLSFECAGENLLGIVSTPLEQQAQADIGVIILVGGPQYRVGSHRQFVQLARHLARNGFPTLRFDHRGMGDSTGTPQTFESIASDINAAISALMARLPKLHHVVLWGLCDAASAALMYQHQTKDPRLHGLALLNPWVRSQATLARAHLKHYYRDRLLQPSFWRKLLRGGLSIKTGADLLANAQAARSARNKQTDDTFQVQMARGWRSFVGHILLITSVKDITGAEFHEAVTTQLDWAGALNRAKLTQVRVADADHTFSNLEHQRKMEAATLDWLRSIDANR